MQTAIELVKAAQDDLFTQMMSETQSMRMEFDTIKGINILNRVLMHLDERSNQYGTATCM